MISAQATFGHEIKISIEASKVAIANAAASNSLTPFIGKNEGIPGLQDQLSYLVFDLTQLPEGTRIVDANVSVFDWEPAFSETAEISLIDVDHDFTSETLTYDLAVANYGAAPITNPAEPVAGLNSMLVRWFGTAYMDNLETPGQATMGSRRIFQSASTFTNDALITTLNDEFTAGDGKATFVYRGTTFNNNSLVGLDFTDSESGPTLELTVVIPNGPGPTTTYNFDTQSLEGWENQTLSTFGSGPTHLNIINEDDPQQGNSNPPGPSSSPSFVGPSPYDAPDGTNARDQDHKSLVLRSPEFRIYGNGSLSFSLIGGSHPYLDLEDVNINGLPLESSSSGAIGIALRRVSDDQYLGFWSRSESSSQSWETITIEGSDLADLVNDKECYTLDYLDTHHGSWGWGGLDDVLIHEGTPTKVYNFDDLSLQGWQPVMTSTVPNGPTQYSILDTTVASVGEAKPPIANSAPALIGPVPYEASNGADTRDQEHDTLLTRSPSFQIYPNGSISFSLIGGNRPRLDLDDANTNGLPAQSSDTGALGFALRRLSDNQYIAFWSRAIEADSQLWETIIINGDTLASLVSGDERYTLDFIDSAHGSWGWACFDDVIIAQGAPDLSYHFDSETLEGWQNITTSSMLGGPTELGILSQDDPIVGDSALPSPHSAPSFVGPIPYEAADGTNTRDQAHETLLLRSPEFDLLANGSISVSLLGGSYPALDFDFDGINANGLPTHSSSEGGHHWICATTSQR
ncbi:hypothetical protein V2O64_21240 [Verrucomicrobiaceae bacterium 227]